MKQGRKLKLLGTALCLSALMHGTWCDAADVVWRKAGLWEVDLWKDGEDATRAVRVQQCTDARSEPDVLLSIVPGQEHCAPLKMSRSPKRRVINTQCQVHGTPVKAQLTMDGDFAVSYRGNFNVQYLAQSVASSPAGTTLFQARWIGPCRSGMVPGDMVLSNGITVNVLKDKKARDSEPL